MNKKTALINDPRMPGGSEEDIKRDYNLDVTVFDDGTFEVEGDVNDVDAYIDDYGIIVEEEWEEEE
jgi:hypothetical protein